MNLGLFTVIECYFDDSYDYNNIPMVTMSGYVATTESWQAFEEFVAPIYEAYGVTILHAKEFHNTDNEFKGWPRDRKARFLIDVFDLLSNHVAFGISFSTLKQAHQQGKAETGLSKMQSAYGFCFNAILDQLMRDDGIQQSIDEFGTKIAIKIEDGNSNNSGLLKSYTRIKAQYELENRFAEITFVGKKDCYAIHMADVIAFYSRRHAQKMEVNDREPVPFDPYLKIILDRIEHVGIAAVEFS